MSDRLWRKARGGAGLGIAESRRALWIETGAVLLLVAAPTLGSITCWMFWGSEYVQFNKQIIRLTDRTQTAFAISHTESIFSYLRLAPVVLYIMWRSGNDWSQFGFVKPRLGRDILIGVGLMLMVGLLQEASWVVEAPFSSLEVVEFVAGGGAPGLRSVAPREQLRDRFFRGVDYAWIPHSAF